MKGQKMFSQIKESLISECDLQSKELSDISRKMSDPYTAAEQIRLVRTSKAVNKSHANKAAETGRGHQMWYLSTRDHRMVQQNNRSIILKYASPNVNGTFSWGRNPWHDGICPKIMEVCFPVWICNTVMQPQKHTFTGSTPIFEMWQPTRVTAQLMLCAVAPITKADGIMQEFL